MSSTNIPLPLHRRIFATFTSPGELFESFRAHAPWFGPLVISTLVAVLLVAAVPEEVFVAQTEGAVNRRGEPVAITSDPSEIARFGRYLGMLGVAVAHPITAFVIAGVLALVFTVLAGGSAEYRQYLAVTTHALLIPALGGLVALVIQLAGGPADAPLSLALLAPGMEPDSALYLVLQALNVFTLWMIAVLALGVSTLNRGRSWGSAAAILLGAYLVLEVALAVAFA
jgi:hypothetical protein